jgi:hypothetical protein
MFGPQLGLLIKAEPQGHKDPAAWPDDLRMIDGKRRTWHFFLMDSLSRALRGLMPVTA